jgi:hypothetical protein
MNYLDDGIHLIFQLYLKPNWNLSKDSSNEIQQMEESVLQPSQALSMGYSIAIKAPSCLIN